MRTHDEKRAEGCIGQVLLQVKTPVVEGRKIHGEEVFTSVEETRVGFTVVENGCVTTSRS